MAGDNKRPPPPSSSSSDRKSRWESTPPSTGAGKSSKTAASGSDSKPPATSNRPSSTNPTTSDKSSTPKRAAQPKPSPGSFSTPPFPSIPDHPPSLGPPSLPPPPPSYGFHMLDRRTIVLADGSVRSYFALPPDYQDFTPPPPRPLLEPMGGARFMPELGRLPPLGPMSPDGFRGREDHPFGPPPPHMGGGGGVPPDYWGIKGRGPEGSLKRKFGEGEERERDGIGMGMGMGRDELARQRMHLLHYGNAGANLGTGGPSSSPFRLGDEYGSSKYMRIGGGGFDNNHNNVGVRDQVDPAVLKAFLNFAKLLYENPNQRKNYLENGKLGAFQCLVCDRSKVRSSKDFPDVHGLIMHTYNSDNADLRVDHLGLHRALCVLMGWSYLRPPDSSRAYQFLTADEAAANQDDLILWPPMVIIHNTSTGKGKDGRMEGMGNKTMDSKLRDLGISGGKSKSLYSRDGHLGITLVKFASDQSGLKEAMRLAYHFEKERHGRNDWARIAGSKDDENNPNLVVVDERTGERKRILYGYLGTAADLDKLDFETRKKAVIESKHERLQPSK